LTSKAYLRYGAVDVLVNIPTTSISSNVLASGNEGKSTVEGWKISKRVNN